MSTLIDRSILEGYLEVSQDKEFIKSLIGYFEIRIPEQVNLIEACYKDQNKKQICRHLHAMKNSFFNVGALEAGNECQIVEDRINELSEVELRAAVQRLLDDHKVILNEVSAFADALPDNLPQASSH